MKRIVQTICGLVLSLSVYVSPAHAQWTTGGRTWAQWQFEYDSRREIYVPFVSDYPNSWGQDNYDTYVTFSDASDTTGNVITESCWQAWTGAGAECRNPTTTSASGQNVYDVWNEGCGAISSDEDSTDYFFEEVAPVYPVSITLYGVAWGS
jgi:hypothetical protein